MDEAKNPLGRILQKTQAVSQKMLKAEGGNNQNYLFTGKET